MKENETKKAWEDPEIAVLSVNENTEYGGNAGEDDNERES